MVEDEWDKAVQNQLQANVALMAVAKGVYAGVAPQAGDSGDKVAFPYVIIDDTDFVDYHTDTETGYEVFMRIYTISRSPGRKETRVVQGLIRAALHRQHATLSITDHSVLFIDREGSTVDEPNDTDGSWRGVCEYRAIVTSDLPD